MAVIVTSHEPVTHPLLALTIPARSLQPPSWEMGHEIEGEARTRTELFWRYHFISVFIQHMFIEHTLYSVGVGTQVNETESLPSRSFCLSL